MEVDGSPMPPAAERRSATRLADDRGLILAHRGVVGRRRLRGQALDWRCKAIACDFLPPRYGRLGREPRIRCVNERQGGRLCVIGLARAVVARYRTRLRSVLLFDHARVRWSIFGQYRCLTEFRARPLSWSSFVGVQALGGESWATQRTINIALRLFTALATYLRCRPPNRTTPYQVGLAIANIGTRDFAAARAALDGSRSSRSTRCTSRGDDLPPLRRPRRPQRPRSGAARRARQPAVSCVGRPARRRRRVRR